LEGEMIRTHASLPSPIVTGLRGRCPRCGEGRLFRRSLDLAERCDACGLDYRFADAGDGPAVFVIFILGAVIVGLALWVELTYEPPMWLHLLLWLPLTLVLGLALLRPMKGLLVSQQFAKGAEEGRREG
jgi:uncharacterized protein (DUF983 family)